MLDFTKTNIIENTLIINNDDGSITCIPEEGATLQEQELFKEFRAEFPNGKPVPPVEQPPYTPSDSERMMMLEQAFNNIIMGGE